MIYDHIVKFNDEYYPAGVEVPEKKKESEKLPFSDEDIEFETEPAKRGRPRKTN